MAAAFRVLPFPATAEIHLAGSMIYVEEAVPEGGSGGALPPDVRSRPARRGQ